MGIVGGGPGSFIGRIHRIAAELDGEAELVCGAFSSDAQRSREAGDAYHINPARAYASYVQMFAAEQALPANERRVSRVNDTMRAAPWPSASTNTECPMMR